MITQNSNAALVDSLWPARSHGLLRFVVLAFMGSMALWAAAKIQVPFYPVPMTLQTFALLGLSAVFGRKLAVATVGFYLLQGALGLPVFAGTPEKGLGLAYMAGPTAGYLAGYLVAAFMVGWAADRGLARSSLTLFPVMLVADAVIFALGVAYMGILFGWDKPLLEWGVYPFVLGDLVKIALAAVAVPALISVMRRFT